MQCQSCDACLAVLPATGRILHLQEAVTEAWHAQHAVWNWQDVQQCMSSQDHLFMHIKMLHTSAANVTCHTEWQKADLPKKVSPFIFCPDMQSLTVALLYGQNP